MHFFRKIAALGAFSLLALAAAPAQAQVNININTGPPVVVGAPANAQYYYVPEIDGYYDVPARRYLVQRNGKWARYEHLDGYDTRNFHPQYIDYRGNSPWTYNRGGNPHGLPPGQAKKYRQDDYEHGHGKNKDKGHGKGHDRH